MQNSHSKRSSWGRLRWLLAILFFLLVAFAFKLSVLCSHDLPRLSPEVVTSAVAHLRGEPGFTPYVPAGHHTWTDQTAKVLYPGTSGVVVFDYNRVACVANLQTAQDLRNITLPDHAPDNLILVSENSKPLDGLSPTIRLHAGKDASVRWFTRRRQLAIEQDCLIRVRQFGKRAVAVSVPFHSACVAQQTDFYSQGFVGCTALVLSNGDYAIYAHCLTGDKTATGKPWPPTHFTVARALPRLIPLTKEIGGSWRVFIAADPVTIKRIIAGCRKADIPIAQAIEMDASGYTVLFSHRAQAISVVPIETLE